MNCISLKNTKKNGFSTNPIVTMAYNDLQESLLLQDYPAYGAE